MTAQARRPNAGGPRRRRRLYEPIPSDEPVPPPPEGPPAEPTEEAVAPALVAEDTPALAPGPPAVPAATVDVVAAAAGKEAEASRIVRKYVYWSAGIGLVAVPILSTGVTLGVQVKMVRDLARLYGVPFAGHRAETLLTTMLGGLGTVVVSRPLITHALVAAGPVTWPLVPAAGATAASLTTYAIGRMFIHHFEQGGTLLDFRPEARRASLAAQLQG